MSLWLRFDNVLRYKLIESCSSSFGLLANKREERTKNPGGGKSKMADVRNGGSQQTATI